MRHSPGFGIVPQVVNARTPRSRGGNAREPKHATKGVVRHGGGDPPISCRQKHVIIRYGQAASPFEVLVKDFHHGVVQGNHAALAKLGATDLQNTVGQHVIESEVERLRNAEPGCGNQSKQRSVDFSSKRVRLAKPTSGLHELHNLLWGVDVRQAPAHRHVKQIGRNLMSRILSVQKAGQACNVSQPDVASVRGRSSGGPFRRRGSTHVRLAPTRGETGVSAEIER
jgi:hypothetical protein